REDHGCGAQRAKIGGPDWFWPHIFHLTGASIVASHFSAVDDVGIERIGGCVTVFLDADGMPFAKRDLAIVPAAGDASRAAVLLAAAQPVWKCIVVGDVVHGGGRLVV